MLHGYRLFSEEIFNKYAAQTMFFQSQAFPTAKKARKSQILSDRHDMHNMHITQFVPRKFSRKLGPCQCERTISPGILLIKRPLERNFCSKCQYLNSLQTSAFQPERQCVLMVRMINSCCVDDKHGGDENHRTSNSIRDTERPSAWGIYKI